MNLDAQQKDKVAAWIQEGLSLSQIQNRLASELGLTLTYMEVRFLLDDLRLRPQDKEPPKSAELGGVSPTAGVATTSPGGAKAQSPRQAAQPTPSQPAPAEGRVSVTVDQVARPGALVSGQVSFTDGNSAAWYLDQFGRLGLAPKQTGYKPSQPDLMAFQAELQSELAKLGF
jgi:hypothetical protein